MRVPVRWLRDLVDTDASAQDIARRLTMAGLEAEAITEIGATWNGVFVGHVERVEPHPNADRLVLATVAAGEHHLTVVTGAPNIREGQKVALALVGARLIDGHSEELRLITLKANTIRGVRSEGMVCSEKELGISDEHEGIMVLEPVAPVGTPLRDYLGDEVIEFEITPNLVHAFSMIGIARELAALVDRTVHVPPLAELGAEDSSGGLVTVAAPDLCARYVAVVIEGLRVEPSPQWIQRRLLAAGVRPINNVVDVTNYVMLEWGQPLHAFDRSVLHEGRIIVRRARPGERIETIDHVDRELSTDTLVIADRDRAVGIAGVMGGVDSEIRDDTTSILLESANFNMLNVRHTARTQRLRTEASARFERGLDPNLAWTAAQRAVALIRELIPEATATGVADVYPEPLRPRTLTMPRSEIPRLLGVDYPDGVVLDALDRLGFQPEIREEDRTGVVVVQVPTWRSDVTIKADLVEEVARVVGYDSLPETLPVGQTPPVERDPLVRLERDVQDLLAASGLSQIITYPMLNEADLRNLEPGAAAVPARYGFQPRPDLPPVAALNPLRTEWELMRPTLLPAWMKNVAENLKFSPSVAVFETGRVYLPRGLDELPNERRTLCLGLAGERHRLSLYLEPRPVDYFDVKGIVDALLSRLGAEEVAYRPVSHPSLHPGRAAEVSVVGRPVGILGEVHPAVAQQFGIVAGQRVALAEIDLATLFEIGLPEILARPVPRFQPIEQDFAVVVDESTPADSVAASIQEGAGFFASGVRLFDIYRGPAIGPGKKSLAFRVTLAAPDRTPAAHEVERVRSRIEAQLKKQVGGTLRV
ncbi:MAG TPA: phenylalanine--tRNA ligase subunit beta [Thermomicrobiaceae bacterium]|nr:phenylalanine--tRNA ligase subunit beta [Thermomicrobiaceae bacterium]